MIDAVPDPLIAAHPLPVVEEPQQLRLISALVVALWLGLFLALPFVLQAGSIIFLPFVAAITAESLVMKIILYVLGFFALIGFLLIAGCFKLVF